MDQWHKNTILNVKYSHTRISTHHLLWVWIKSPIWKMRRFCWIWSKRNDIEEELKNNAVAAYSFTHVYNNNRHINKWYYTEGKVINHTVYHKNEWSCARVFMIIKSVDLATEEPAHTLHCPCRIYKYRTIYTLHFVVRSIAVHLFTLKIQSDTLTLSVHCTIFVRASVSTVDVWSLCCVIWPAKRRRKMF